MTVHLSDYGGKVVEHVIVSIPGGGVAYVNPDLWHRHGLAALSMPGWYMGQMKKTAPVVQGRASGGREG